MNGLAPIADAVYQGLAGLTSLRSHGNTLPFSSPLNSASAQPSISVRDDAGDSTVEQVSAMGNKVHQSGTDFVELGDSGVSIKVSDLRLAEEDTTAIIDGKKYITDSYLEGGKLEVRGSDAADKISVTQDDSGDTWVHAVRHGKKAFFNAGRIAAVSLEAGAGNDVVELRVKNYFGGVSVYGGAGKDEMDIAADFSLDSGLVVEGGADNDKITSSGGNSALSVEGGEGSDRVDASEFQYSGLEKVIRGGEGADILLAGYGGEVYGDAGSDLLSLIDGGGYMEGGDGDDVIYGGRGDDRILGGEGNDVLQGHGGDDSIYGGDGDDLLMGGSGNDFLSGGHGDDSLYGSSISNELHPSSLSGRVEQVLVSTLMSGGSGTDTFAPASPSPWEMNSYTGAGEGLLDYDRDLDILL